jgi:peptide/nickel transport system substrate-binding protein
MRSMKSKVCVNGMLAAGFVYGTGSNRVVDKQSLQRRWMMARKLFLLLIVMGLICSVGLPSSVGAQEEPKKGGTFIVAIPQNPPHFLAASTSNTFASLAGCPLYPALLAYDSDANMKPLTTELAESYTFDGKNLQFNLRKNVKWSDGTPLTSADVKFTLENITSKLHPHGNKFLSALDRVDTPDNYTAIVRLKNPYAPLPSFFHWHYCTIVPKHIWEPYLGRLQDCPEYKQPKTVAGAWKLKEYISGDHITYEANPDYWKPNKPYLDRLIFKIIPDAVTEVAALEAGEVDMLIPVMFPATEAERLKKNSQISVTRLGFEIRGVFFYLFFNVRQTPLGDKKVRKALAYAIDRRTIIDNVASGYGFYPDSPIPEGPMWNAIRKTPTVTYPYDVTKARQLLDEAGYPKRQDGMRNISITFASVNIQDMLKIAEMVKAYWKDVGVDTTILAMDEGAFEDRIFKKQDFGVTISDFGVAGDFSVEGRVYQSKGIGKLWNNPMGYSNNRIDWLFDNVAAETDANKQKAYYAELQDILADELPVLWLYQSTPPHAFSNKFGGLPVRPHAQFSSWDFIWWKGGKPIK